VSAGETTRILDEVTRAIEGDLTPVALPAQPEDRRY
jgi:hypothetical protein